MNLSNYITLNNKRQINRLMENPNEKYIIQLILEVSDSQF